MCEISCRIKTKHGCGRCRTVSVRKANLAFRLAVAVAVLTFSSGCALAGTAVVHNGKADRDPFPLFEINDAAALGLPALGLHGTAYTIAPVSADAGLDMAFEPVSERSPFVEGLSFDERLDRLWVRRDATRIDGYGGDKFLEQSLSVPYDVALLFGGLTALGIKSWRWGTADFHFNDEGWFGMETGSMGMDKLGHAYTTYLFTEYLTQRILQESDDPRGAALTAAALSMGLQTYVEVFDGFSIDHGFSREDIIANMTGAVASILRSTIPGLAEKVDFRLEYIPSGDSYVSPVSDYYGQKYLLAVKLSGFEMFEDTPMRFLELQAGYYARGATRKERRREPYLGIAFNLQELFADSDWTSALIARRSLEYIQVPYTYIATTRN